MGKVKELKNKGIKQKDMGKGKETKVYMSVSVRAAGSATVQLIRNQYQTCTNTHTLLTIFVKTLIDILSLTPYFKVWQFFQCKTIATINTETGFSFCCFCLSYIHLTKRPCFVQNYIIKSVWHRKEGICTKKKEIWTIPSFLINSDCWCLTLRWTFKDIFCSQLT